MNVPRYPWSKIRVLVLLPASLPTYPDESFELHSPWS